MFIERNEFHLKFGHARQAINLWKEYLEKARQVDNTIHARLYADLTGRAYTVVLELQVNSYAELEPSKCRLTQQTGWKEFYQQFIPLCEFSERKLYKLEMTY